MKPCLICHHEADDNAATCPMCGEASWGVVLEVESVQIVDEKEPVSDEVPGATAPPDPIPSAPDAVTIEVDATPPSKPPSEPGRKSRRSKRSGR